MKDYDESLATLAKEKAAKAELEEKILIAEVTKYF